MVSVALWTFSSDTESKAASSAYQTCLPARVPPCIYSARWQDGFAVKLSNPPPKTLGVLSGSMNAGTGARDSLRGGDVSDAGAANQAANEAAKGAVTIGFVGSFIGTAIFVSAALCLILRRASHGGGGTLSRGSGYRCSSFCLGIGDLCLLRYYRCPPPPVLACRFCIPESEYRGLNCHCRLTMQLSEKHRNV